MPTISVLRPPGLPNPFLGGSPFTVPGLHLKMPRSAALFIQDGWLNLRPASACALQGVPVALARRHSGWLSRPAPVLGCLTSQRPLRSCVWLLPCTGSVPRRRPHQLQVRAGDNRAWEERFLSMLPLLRPGPRRHGQPASSVQDASRHRVARAPHLRWASSRVR